MLTQLKRLLHHESASGVLLVCAAILALLLVNSPWQNHYQDFFSIPVKIQFGQFAIDKPLLLWINDGLMAIFFFIIGLEVKREILAGELSQPAKVILPLAGAIGGMAVPAMIYSVINWGDVTAMRGWAIPSATDIAFALGVLALLGKRVPPALKIFLMTLAIADDLGAIVIIAFFYTSELSFVSLVIAGIAVLGLAILNQRRVLDLTPYLLLGLVLWAAVLKSGVHATLAGVIIAFFIPYRKLPGAQLTQLENLEKDLHPAVAFGILPLFAFANSGVSLTGLSISEWFGPIPMGIAAGLFFGNQLGVFGCSWLAVKLGWARLPDQVRWAHIYGVGALCGIGFTMSLFIASLAFQQGPEALALVQNDRLGILMGSTLSALYGYFFLRWLGRSSPSSV